VTTHQEHGNHGDHARHEHAGEAPAEHWERRYTEHGQLWSGRVNTVLADIAAGLTPGTALDLGCGEGADVIWLAEHGWQATGVDISATAIGRGQAAATAAGVAERATFVTADLSTLTLGAGGYPAMADPFDLVTASFLHSTVELPREDILRRATGWVRSGGHLLITAHAAPPPWHPHAHEDRGFPTPEEDVATLGLDPQVWEVVLAETRPRLAVGPDGQDAHLDDSVVLVRRG
jgi:SAM-dependent methyltransferase